MLILLFLLTGSLTLQTPVQTQQTPDARAEAVQLAESGSYDAALDRFRALAAANPADLEARLWIGRVEVRMRRLTAAETVFRSVLLDDPEHVDTLMELGGLLTTTGRLSEALAFLGRAEKLEPDNPAVLAALGRTHRLAGRNELALAYYQRAALAAPQDPAITLRLERVQRLYGHRVKFTYFNESLDIASSDSQSGELSLNYRATDRLRLSVIGQRQRTTDRTESRAGAAVEWRPQWPVQVTLRAHEVAGQDTVLFPGHDFGGEIEVRRQNTSFRAGVRRFGFGTAHVWTVTPGITHEIEDRAVLSAWYAHSLTAFSYLVENVGSHSVGLDARIRVQPRIWLDAGYGLGVENFDRFSADRLGRFNAGTLSGGVVINLRRLTSLVADYEHQWREDDSRMRRFTASIVQRF